MECGHNDCFTCPYDDCIVGGSGNPRRDDTLPTDPVLRSREHGRRYRMRHPDKCKAVQRQYYLEHREEVIARTKAYYYAHRDEITARARAERAAKRAQ